MTLKTSSTIPTIGTALTAAWRARGALSRIPITDGLPEPGILEGPEWVMIGDVEFEQAARAMDVTSRPRVEDYRVKVMVSVTRAGRGSDVQAAANARAWELFAELEQGIRDNPTLTGYYVDDGQIVAVQIGTGTFSKRATDTVREATIETELVVRARI